MAEKKDKLKFREVNGKTRVGTALQFLKENGKEWAGEILDIAGELTGKEALERIGEKLKGETRASSQDKDILMKQLELDIEEAKQETLRADIEAKLTAQLEQNITDRWTSDNKADTKLARNIRPLSFAAMMVLTMLITILSSMKGIQFAVPGDLLDLLQYIDLTMIVAYFGGRTVEKLNKKSPFKLSTWAK